MIDLSGVFTPITTPFDPRSGEIDPVALRRNVAVLAASAPSGFVLFGTTGEGLLLDEEERLAATEQVRSAAGALLVLVATGAESTRATARRCRAAGDVGADGVLVAPPSYYRPQMTPDALVAHYHAVADGSPVPVVLYQVPRAYASVELGTDLVARLAGHPNIAGIKDSAGDLSLLSGLVAASGRGFSVLVGSGGIFHGALQAGAVGGILGVANLAPGMCRDVFRLSRLGDQVKAGEIQERLALLHREIVARYGVPGVKAALDLIGQAGGPPRLPLLPLGEGDRAAVAAALVDAGLLDPTPPTAHPLGSS